MSLAGLSYCAAQVPDSVKEDRIDSADLRQGANLHGQPAPDKPHRVFL